MDCSSSTFILNYFIMQTFKHSEEQKDILMNFLVLIAQFQKLLILNQLCFVYSLPKFVYVCAYTQLHIYITYLHADIYRW